MIIKEILREGKKNLEKKHINTYHLDAELLLAYVIKKNREFLFTNPEFELKKEQAKQYLKLIKKRNKYWSVATLIGIKEFYDLEFFVNKNTLIPRPESEMFIDEIINLKIEENTTFIDVGTGSGCLIISLIKKIKNNNSKHFNFLATDVSNKALKIAKKNAKKHLVEKEINFYKGDLLQPIIKKLKDKKDIIILANLPYLTKKQLKNSPSIKKEPKKALLAGCDGLKYYKKLISQIAKHLKKQKVTLLLEIDDSQAKKLKDLFKKSEEKWQVKIKKDLNGLFRLIIVNKI